MQSHYCLPCRLTSLVEVRPMKPALPASNTMGIAAGYFHLTVPELKEKCRIPSRVAARRMTYAYLKSRYGLKDQRIGQIFGQNQSTVCHHLQEHTRLIRESSKYLRKWTIFILHMDAKVNELSKMYRVNTGSNPDRKAGFFVN